MATITRGQLSEFDEVVDFFDFVFSKSYSPSDFRSFLPIAYRPEEESVKNMILLREGKELRAALLYYPATLSVLGEEIKFVGIGSVAVHPRYRGMGYMKDLLNYSLSEMKKGGVQLSELCGQRQRYGYFGYEMGGDFTVVDLTFQNIRHAEPNYQGGDYTFQPIQKEDTDILKAVHQMHQSHPIHRVIRSEDFYDRLIGRGAIPYAAYNSNGKLIGYLLSNKERTLVPEIVCEDSKESYPLIRAWSYHCKTDIKYYVSPWEATKLQDLYRICTDVLVSTNGLWQVFDWMTILRTFLTLKSTFLPLLDGSLTFEVDQQKIKVEVKEGKPVVSSFDGQADFTLNSAEAMRLMVSMPSRYYALEEDRIRSLLLRSWFPLPIYLHSPNLV